MSAPPLSEGVLARSPGLDVLRGLAVALVVGFHFGRHHLFRGGWAGVDVFFVLSGFLITSLLLDEHARTGRVRLRAFWARRALRLLPALLVMLLLWLPLLLLFHHSSWFAATPSTGGTGRAVSLAPSLADLPFLAGFASNWLYAAHHGAAPLAHLWSVAVEAQFYLLWSLVLVCLARCRARVRTQVVGALAGTAVLVPLLLAHLGADHNRLYFGTDARSPALLLGAFAACWWRARLGAGRPAASRVLAGVGALGLALITWRVQAGPVKFVYGPTLTALCTLPLVCLLASPRSSLPRSSPLFHLPQPRVLTWLGERSYALYLYHYLFATWTHPLPALPATLLGVTASLLLAEISWRLVEAPSLAWAHSHLSPGRRSPCTASFAPPSSPPPSFAPPSFAPPSFAPPSPLPSASHSLVSSTSSRYGLRGESSL